MPIKLGPITLPFGQSKEEDPYWDRFLKTAPNDKWNAITEVLRNQTEGNVAPVKAELHTPEITSTHIKELAVYVGSDLTGILRLKDDPDGYEHAVVCVVKAEHDPREAAGIGGQVPVMNGQFSTFIVASYIRELGWRATTARNPDANAEWLAAWSGIGNVNAQGRLVTKEYGDKVHVADVIRTDLPLAPDGDLTTVGQQIPTRGES